MMDAAAQTERERDLLSSRTMSGMFFSSSTHMRCTASRPPSATGAFHVTMRVRVCTHVFCARTTMHGTRVRMHRCQKTACLYACFLYVLPCYAEMHRLVQVCAVHSHTHTHTCIYTYIHTYIHTHKRASFEHARSTADTHKHGLCLQTRFVSPKVYCVPIHTYAFPYAYQRCIV